MLTKAEVLSALKWSEPREMVTEAYGPRVLRTVSCKDEDVERYWTRNKAELSAMGIGRREYPKGKGTFQLSWWTASAISAADRARNLETSRALDALVKIPAPPGLEYRGYQRAGISWMRDKMGVLLGDDMGLGKTIQIIGFINDSPPMQRILIVCPASLQINWRQELNIWLLQKYQIGYATGKIFPSSNIVIISYTMLWKWREKIGSIHWDLIAADEAHELCGRVTQKARVLLGYHPKKEEPPELKSSPAPARRRIFATGTPVLNNRKELWPLVSCLNPVIFNNWFWFSERASAAEVQQRMRETVMIRRLKSQVLTELPPKVRTVIILEDTTGIVARERWALGQSEEDFEQAAVALELAKAAETDEEYWAQLRAVRSKVSVPFDQIAAVRHSTALAKAPFVVELLLEWFKENDKIVVFAHHLGVIEILRVGLAKFNPVLVIGEGMSKEQKNTSVLTFQNDKKCRLFIGGIKPAGVGLTLTAAQLVVFAELDWTPAKVTQAEDRLHRIGQKGTVNVKHVVLQGSLDGRMTELIVQKQRLADSLLDDLKAEEINPNAMDEPVIPKPRGAIDMTRKELTAEATLTDRQIQAVAIALRRLAGMCDGARELDGAGFNKFDAQLGAELASRLYLSPRQAALGRRIVLKYRRQLGEDLVKAINETTP